MSTTTIIQGAIIVVLFLLFMLYQLYSRTIAPANDDEQLILICAAWLDCSDYRVFEIANEYDGFGNPVDADFLKYIQCSDVPTYVRHYVRDIFTPLM